MTEQALDLRRIGRALRRHWMTVFSAGCIGVVLGLAFAYLQTPVYSASSAVLLPPSPKDDHGNPLRNVATEVQIAMSADLLDQAGKAFAPALSGSALRSRVKVSAVTIDILAVKAQGSSGRAAASLANAVAGAYVNHSNTATSELVDTTVSDLESRAAELDQRIKALQAEIEANVARLGSLPSSSAAAGDLAAATEVLRADTADAARQLATAKTRIADAKLSADLARRGTKVIQGAGIPATPISPKPLVDAFAGGLVGLALASAWALVKDHGRPQPLRRAAVADATKAPVLASLSAPRPGRAERCGAVLRNWHPSAVEAAALQQAFRHLGATDDKPANVDIVVLPGDRSGPVLAAQIAVGAASTGTPTALVVATEHPAAAALRAACAATTGGPAGRDNLSIRTVAGDGEALDQPGGGLSLAVVVAEGIAIRFPVWRRTSVTVLAVSASFATPELLAGTAERCRDLGHPLAGVFVADPDPKDATSGRLDLPPLRTDRTDARYVDADTVRRLRAR